MGCGELANETQSKGGKVEGRYLTMDTADQKIIVKV